MDRSQKADAVASAQRSLQRGRRGGRHPQPRPVGGAVHRPAARRCARPGRSYKVCEEPSRQACPEGHATTPASTDTSSGPTALAPGRSTRLPPPRRWWTSPRRTTSSKSSAVPWASTLLDADGIKALASLPSLDELRGKIVGLVQAPATKIAQLVNAPGGAARPRLRRLWRQGSRVRRFFPAIYPGISPGQAI